MGREAVTMEASASVSRHNDEQDAIDGKAWNEFCRRVRELAEEYGPQDRDVLTIDVMGGDIYYHGRED